MRFFQGSSERPGYEEVMSEYMSDPGRWETSKELDRLYRLLERRGAQFEAGRAGPFKGIMFQSPRGEVSVIYGPGAEGSDSGLLESFCDGYDMAPRGNMTARKVIDEYFSGAW